MFKIYKNRKTNHPSISIRQKNKRYWWNMPMTHSKPTKDTSLVIDDPHPRAKKEAKLMLDVILGKTKEKLEVILIVNVYCQRSQKKP